MLGQRNRIADRLGLRAAFGGNRLVQDAEAQAQAGSVSRRAAMPFSSSETAG